MSLKQEANITIDNEGVVSERTDSDEINSIGEKGADRTSGILGAVAGAVMGFIFGGPLGSLFGAIIGWILTKDEKFSYKRPYNKKYG